MKEGQIVTKERNNETIYGFVISEVEDNLQGDHFIHWHNSIRDDLEWEKNLTMLCQTCNQPHEETYGENNEWCENCVPY